LLVSANWIEGGVHLAEASSFREAIGCVLATLGKRSFTVDQ